ncbi:Major facilitator superfamily (MFS) profile [Nakaseomyces glabratus]|nr:Major facilitator superfamily (MFS) profile [Nakaseomyces glabratus]
MVLIVTHNMTSEKNNPKSEKTNYDGVVTKSIAFDGCEECSSSDECQSNSDQLSVTSKGCICSEDDCHENDSPFQNPEYFETGFKEVMFIISCMVAQLLNQAGQTQSLSTMNVLADFFKSDSSKQPWLMASFPLVSGSFILISGRLGDIYGLKKALSVGYIIMTLWSIICGLAKYTNSDAFFIVCRSFQGLGIAFILPNIMGLVGNIYKVGTLRKNIVISCIGCMAPAGAALGALFGGLIVTEDAEQWPWVFYAFGIASFVNMLLALYSIPNNVPTNLNNLNMDWIGSLLGVSGLLLLNIVWNQAPIVGWGEAYIIVLLIISIILLLIFVVYEIKYATSPLLPPSVLENKKILMILAALFFGWGSFGIWTYYYYAFQLNLRKYTPLWAGGTHFMFVIWGTVAAFVVALTIKKVGPAVLLCFSMVAFDCGSIMLSVTPVHQTYWRMNVGMQIILSFGMDLSFPASSIILSDFLPMQYQGMAGSLVNTVVNYSTSLCLGMGNTVEQQYNAHGADLLKGYRSALYLAIGLASAGVCVSLVFLVTDIIAKRHRKRIESECESC